MAAPADNNVPKQVTRPRTEVFERNAAKRRTTISLSKQADDDINELMRRSRQTVPGNVIGDAVRLMRMLPPEFVAVLLNEMDKGNDGLKSTCRSMMLTYYECQAKRDKQQNAEVDET